MWLEKDAEEAVYSEYLELDLSTVVPSIAGPKRPQDRIEVSKAKEQFRGDLENYVVDGNGIEKSSVDTELAGTFPASDAPSHDALEASLAQAGLGYTYVKELGGLRKRRPDSVNTQWRNASFQGYADHMGTEEFERGLTRLLEIAEEESPVIMCAEAVPWRCHRSLVGDALLVRGVTVLDIIGDGAPKEHTLTSFAVVDGTRLTYPGTADEGVSLDEE